MKKLKQSSKHVKRKEQMTGNRSQDKEKVSGKKAKAKRRLDWPKSFEDKGRD